MFVLPTRSTPTHHRVLVEIVVRPPGDRVQLHEVVKVTDLPPHPLLSEP